MPEGQRFRVIVADNPWRYDDKLTMGGDDGVKRSADSQYKSTMSLPRILKMPVPDVSMGDCLLACWVTSPLLLDHGRRTMKAWGFDYKQTWVWVKTGGQTAYIQLGPEDGIPDYDLQLAFPMGRLSRTVCEFILMGTRGNMLRHLESKRERNVLLDPPRGHSVKTEKLQDALERMFPGAEKHPKLELFARRQRPGWTCIGNEAPATEGEDIFDSLGNLIYGE